MRLELARHPRRLLAKHPIILDELLALEEDGKQRGVAMMIRRNAPDMESLRVVLEVIEAYQMGIPVFEAPST